MKLTIETKIKKRKNVGKDDGDNNEESQTYKAREIMKKEERDRERLKRHLFDRKTKRVIESDTKDKEKDRGRQKEKEGDRKKGREINRKIEIVIHTDRVKER